MFLSREGMGTTASSGTIDADINPLQAGNELHQSFPYEPLSHVCIYIIIKIRSCFLIIVSGFFACGTAMSIRPKFFQATGYYYIILKVTVNNFLIYTLQHLAAYINNQK